MNFEIPEALKQYLATLDRFIETEIRPLEQADDNIRFFDHRREWARTDFDNGGLPRHEWEALLRRGEKPADAAGDFRLAISKRYRREDGPQHSQVGVPRRFSSKGFILHQHPPEPASLVG